MPGMIFKVESVGDDPILIGERLARSGESVNKMKQVMNNIFDDMLYVTLQNIESRGRRRGGSWKNLTDKTIERKGGGEIFYTSGAYPGYSSIGGDALVRSVTKRGTKFQIRTVTNETAQLGTRRPYARDHQFGKSRSKTGDLPARPFLQFGQQDVDKWESWISAKLLESFTRK